MVYYHRLKMNADADTINRKHADLVNAELLNYI